MLWISKIGSCYPCFFVCSVVFMMSLWAFSVCAHLAPVPQSPLIWKRPTSSSSNVSPSSPAMRISMPGTGGPKFTKAERPRRLAAANWQAAKQLRQDANIKDVQMTFEKPKVLPWLYMKSVSQRIRWVISNFFKTLGVPPASNWLL